MTRGKYNVSADKGRGNYAPRDHLLVQWTAGRAVKKRITPHRDHALRALYAIEAAHEGMGDAYAGSTVFRDHGQTRVAQVGGEWWHGMADRMAAMRIISTGFAELRDDIAAFTAQAATDVPNAGAIAEWLARDLAPAIAEFQRFVARENDSWLLRAVTQWDAYESWRNRLVRLRELARALGLPLASPEPPPLPKTIWQKNASGTGDTGATIVGAIRLVALGVLGIWGATKLYGAVRDMRDMARVEEAPSDEHEGDGDGDSVDGPARDEPLESSG